MAPKIVLHGHFYQPPRENPWTGSIERQHTAAPDHDWNERIARECYSPNVELANLEHVSFDFGPTLLAWADRAAPQLSKAVAAADAAAVARTGSGRGMAQLYSHPIAPLLGERDLRTQVRWGVADFERRFGRRPEGMWLPECAVDLASLRALEAEGIRYTILAADQGARWRDGESWESNGGAVDSRAPARVDLGEGRSIAVFFFHRPLSQALSFGDALADPKNLIELWKREAAAAGANGMVLAATDGETFGHHKKDGARVLAEALATLGRDPEVEVTTPAAILRAGEPARWAEIRERTSWSCAHGVERWRSDCGCRHAESQQSWRAPLREAIETLTARLHAVFERAGGEVLRDPWETRDRTAGLPPEALEHQEWLRGALRHPDRPAELRRALRLLEMERQLLFSHTSCGWFFDDIGGLEPVQNLRSAARAIELSRAGAAVEDELLAILRRAPSNDRRLGDGATVYRKLASKAALDPIAIAARAAFRWVVSGKDGPTNVAGFQLTADHFACESRGKRAIATGVVRVADPFDAADLHFAFAALSMGDGEVFAYFGPAREPDRTARAAGEARAAFRAGRSPELLRTLWLRFPTRLVHQSELSADEREELARVTPPA